MAATAGQRLGDGFATSKARVMMAVTVTVTAEWMSILDIVVLAQNEWVEGLCPRLELKRQNKEISCSRLGWATAPPPAYPDFIITTPVTITIETGSLLEEMRFHQK